MGSAGIGTTNGTGSKAGQLLRKVVIVAMLLVCNASYADLFFSEYVEGSSNNKALEIYNPTGSAVDLSTYTIERYNNGGTTPSMTPLVLNVIQAELASGATLVIANPSAAQAVLDVADYAQGEATFYNGDDVLLLKNGTAVIDSIGKLGEDPGSAWGSGDNTTAEHTLRRKAFITTGDSNPDDAFDPATEWDAFAQDTFDGLGAHTVEMPSLPAKLLITEIVTGPADNEFIEIHNPNGYAVELSDYYLTDATFAGGSTYYYNIVTGANAGGGGFSDFNSRFPDGATIAAGAYQTIALNGAEAFNTVYGQDPTYELYEVNANAVPDMREAVGGDINNQGGLSPEEVVVLYYWDGATDLVTDVDYLVWGDKAEAVDKSGVALDGPDGDADTTAYQDETATADQAVPGGEPANGMGYSRSDLTEGAQVATGGNGVGGRDETSEDFGNTFVEATPSPNAAYVPPTGGPGDYYDGLAQGLTGTELKAALHTLVKTGHTPLSYGDFGSGGTADAMASLFEDPSNSNNLIVIYKQTSVPKANYVGAIDGDDSWNHEHLFPQSKWTNDDSFVGRTDLHHLAPSDKTVNGDRGHLDFDNGGSVHPEAGQCKSDSDSWEPPDAVKGDIARAIFYMDARYESDDAYDLALADTAPSAVGELAVQTTLLAWHQADPVDQAEQDRNDAIQALQGNRNPFIDHPEWVGQIWQPAGDPIMNQDFELGSLGDWTTVSVASNADWGITSYGGNTYVQANGYGGDAPSDDWLISPEIPLDYYTGETLQFEAAWKYDGPVFEIYVLQDYDPQVHVNPADAVLTQVSIDPWPFTTGNYTMDPSGIVDLSAYAGNCRVAFRYVSTGTGSGDGRIWQIDNVAVSGIYEPPSIHSETFDSDLGSWTQYSAAQNEVWHYYSGMAEMNGYNDRPDTNMDWLISPALDLTDAQAVVLRFESEKKYGADTALGLKVSTDYAEGDPAAASWTDLTGAAWPTAADTLTPSGDISLADYAGNASVRLAFYYNSPGDNATRWRVDNVQVIDNLPLAVTFVSDQTYAPAGSDVTFVAEGKFGSEPFTYTWNFGDGNTAGPSVSATQTHAYAAKGIYDVSCTVTDALGAQSTTIKEQLMVVYEPGVYTIPVKAMDDLRVASFNCYLNRPSAGELVTDLTNGDDEQAKAVAEIIQRTRPDIILLNEFDYDANNPTEAITLFQNNYLMVSQNGAAAIDYPHVYVPPTNTGVHSGHDLNNDGFVDGTVPAADASDSVRRKYGEDCFGYGDFPGQYGFVVLSMYDIDEANIRTFQEFLWDDMPNHMYPVDPATGDGWYAAAEWDVLRLSSKNHCDIPVDVNGTTVHILASHPTPPTFDGAEDRNGHRNYDEIRFWNDYITPGENDYIYDDEGATGGFTGGERFVIMGDQNATPADEGDSLEDDLGMRAIEHLLYNPLVNQDINTVLKPASEGGTENAPTNIYSAWHTADWRMRADYAIPSASGMTVTNSAVFWPETTDDLYYLVGPGVKSSDHRMVWIDVTLSVEEPVVLSDLAVSTLSHSMFRYHVEIGNNPGTVTVSGLPAGLAFDEATGMISGVPTAIGTASVTIEATNDAGTTTETLELTVSAAEAAKYVILMVSDGCGYNTWRANGLYEEGDISALPYMANDWVKVGCSTYAASFYEEKLPNGGNNRMLVYDPTQVWDPNPVRGGGFAGYNYLNDTPTDSAAAGTALGTGVKTYASGINWAPAPKDLGYPLSGWNISEITKSLGRSAGVVTSVPFSHATPASLGGATNISRYNTAELAAELLSEGVLDVVMGCGHPLYDDSGNTRSANYSYIGQSDFDALVGGTHAGGWTYVEEKSDFEALAAGTLSAGKVMGLAKAGSTLQQSRSGATLFGNFNADVPDLPTMTRGAIRTLESNAKGFFLMVEGGAVDWANHGKNAERMLEEQADFNATVEAVVDWIEDGANDSSWSNTLVIITSDHDNGLVLGPDADTVFFDPIEDNGQGAMPGLSYNAGAYDHTNALVPLFARGAGADAFYVYADEEDPNPYGYYFDDDATNGDAVKYVDNTEVFHVMEAVTRSGETPSTETVFPQSVASGDPRPDSVVLWTRVNGAKGGDLPVMVEVATDMAFADVVFDDDALLARQDHDYCVKVKATGLTPWTTYYYRFTHNGVVSRTGRTKTAPADDADVDVSFAFFSCQDYIGRYYNALADVVQRDEVDFLVHVGDYIYETTGDPTFQSTAGDRRIAFTDSSNAIELGEDDATYQAASSLSNYRTLYKTYRSDPALQKLHEMFPMINIWDDHEYTDDSWQDVGTYHDEREDEQNLARRRNAEQAFFEFLPSEFGMDDRGVSISGADVYPNAEIYRSFRFGKHLDLILTDYRSYRPDHLIPESAFPGTIAVDQATVEAALAGMGYQVAQIDGTVATLDPYVDWANLDPSLQAGLEAIVAGAYQLEGLSAGDAADMAEAVLTGNLSVTYINGAFAAAGQPEPIADTTGLDRGISFLYLGKQSMFGSTGSRYMVVRDLYQLYAGILAQADPSTQNVLGDEQAVFVGEALATTDATWPVLASSVSFCPTTLDLSMDLGVPLDPTMQQKFALNVDQWEGFPQAKQQMLADLAAAGAVVISGDIHASFVTEHTTDNGKVMEFTGSAVSSGSFNDMVRGAAMSLFPGDEGVLSLVDQLDDLLELGATVDPAADIKMADTTSHGYVVLKVGADKVDALFRLTDGDEVYTDHYGADADGDQPVTQLFGVDTFRVYRDADNGDALALTAVEPVAISVLGTYDSGDGEGAAEITGYDAGTKRLFVTNVVDETIDVIDLTMPSAPALIGQIDLATAVPARAFIYGGINSIAVKNGLVVAALEHDTHGENGVVAFFDGTADFAGGADGFINSVEVGVLPDMVTFTPDGNTVLVACEGEPNENYVLDPEGSIGVIDISGGAAAATVQMADFTAFNANKAALQAAGVRLFGPDDDGDGDADPATVAQDVEPEYIAVSGDGATAMVTLQENNALAVLDIATATITAIVPLGYKDYALDGNEIDAIDDDVASFANWPVYGMYMPDAIASYRVGGETYYITANEGDDRNDFTDDAEKLEEITLDDAFPNKATVEAELGDLRIALDMGNTDGDAAYEELYSYGGRSFSIWDSQGRLVADSGSELARMVALQTPDMFPHGRSPKKGVEPEGVTVGEVNGRQLAFIGLERADTIAVYDVTDPMHPQFLQMLHNTGDEAPEGLLFIPAANGSPAMLVVSNEDTGTATIYGIYSGDTAAVAEGHAIDLSVGAVSDTATAKWEVSTDGGATFMDADQVLSGVEIARGSMRGAFPYTIAEKDPGSATVTVRATITEGGADTRTEWDVQVMQTPAAPVIGDSFGSGFLGAYNPRIGGGGAEITAFDGTTQRLFVTASETNTLEIVDISTPALPSQVARIDLNSYGAGPNSVACNGALVAVAVEADPKTDPGAVVFFDTDGAYQGQVTVGALPDMLTFTPNGMTLLVANEGEPDDDNVVDPEGSVSIVDLTAGVGGATVTTADFTVFNGTETTLAAEGIRIFGMIDTDGDEVADTAATVAQDLEPEYIAVSPDGSTAMVVCQENNALAVLDIAAGTITDLVGLGFKDHSLPGNEIDASNDDGIDGNFRNWPVLGMYQPDAIASFESAGSTYYITANEGDARDYDAFSEEERVKDLVLDGNAYPDPDGDLTDDYMLGRLNSTTATGDADGDGDIDQIYSYGARSFSIWDADGNLVYDSGTATEKFVLEMTDLWPENRSDDKGTEPEGVTVGTAGGRTLALVGLERTDTVLVADISDLNDINILQALFHPGDDAPEGVLMANNGGEPTLIVSNEDSGTVTLYGFEDGAGNVAVAEGGILSLSVMMEGDGPFSYDWMIDDGTPQRAMVGIETVALESETVGGTLRAMFGSDFVTTPGGSVTRTVTVTATDANSVSLQQSWNVTVRDRTPDTYLTVLHNNDAESKLVNAGPGSWEDFGGADHFVALMEELTEDAEALGDHVLRISSGDNFLPGVSRELSAIDGVDYDAIAFEAVGYVASCLGNHDFDLGPDELAGFINATTNTVFLSCNLDFSGHAGLQALVDAGRIAPSMTTEVDGHKVGIVGATTPILNSISSPGTVTLIDTEPDGDSDFDDVVALMQAEIDALIADGCTIIIAATHMQSIENDIQSVLPHLSGVDLYIAGGGHELLADDDDVLISDDAQYITEIVYGDYPQNVNDKDGLSVPIVTTSGGYRYVGKFEGRFDRAGTLVAHDGGPMRVVQDDTLDDYIEPDEDVAEDVVDPITAYVEVLNAQVIATSEVALDGLKAHVRTQETNLGNLIADALLWQANQVGPQYGAPTAHIALQNGGGIRNDSVIQAGDVTEGDTYSILPFANYVVTVAEIGPAQLKEILENAASNIENTDGRFAQVAGMTVSYDLNGTAQVLDDGGNVTTPGSRVTAVTLNDGQKIVEAGAVVAGAPNVNIATIDFLYTGGDDYPYRGAQYTSFPVTYREALSNYIQDATGLNGTIAAADYPEGGSGRITIVEKIAGTELTVLHNNDSESKIVNAGPGSWEDFGGADHFVALMDQLTAAAEGSGRQVLRISSGDNFLPGISRELGQIDGVDYDALVFDAVGYVASCLGNHDFDEGPDVLQTFIEATSDAVFLSCNLDFSAHAGLQALVGAGRIAPSTTVEVGDIKVGIVGATTPILGSISSPGAVTLIDVEPDGDTDFDDVVTLMQVEIDALLADGCDVIIAATHMQGIENDLQHIVPNLSGVDLYIAGGGHELLADGDDALISDDAQYITEVVYGDYPQEAMDKDGITVPVVTTSGNYRYVGQFTAFYNATQGSFTTYGGGPVRVVQDDTLADYIAPDADVKANVVDPIATYTDALNAEVIAISEVALDGVRTQVRTQETNQGNLIADALLWQANEVGAQYGAPAAQIALQNGGGIRNDSEIPAGNITEGDTYDILPFANFVGTVADVTPAHLKEILENAASRIEYTDGRFAQVAGMKVTYDLNGISQALDDDGNVTTPGSRVSEVTLDGGQKIIEAGAVVGGAPNVNIATIDFLYYGGDDYPFRDAAFTSFPVTYREALSNYLKDPNGLDGTVTAAMYPEGGSGRITIVERDALFTPWYPEFELGVGRAEEWHEVEVYAVGGDDTPVFRTRIKGGRVQVVDYALAGFAGFVPGDYHYRYRTWDPRTDEVGVWSDVARQGHAFTVAYNGAEAANFNLEAPGAGQKTVTLRFNIVEASGFDLRITGRNSGYVKEIRHVFEPNENGIIDWDNEFVVSVPGGDVYDFEARPFNPLDLLQGLPQFAAFQGPDDNGGVDVPEVENPAAPQQVPDNMFPSNGFLVFAESDAGTTQVTLRWQPSVGADGYIVQLVSGNRTVLNYADVGDVTSVDVDLLTGSYTWLMVPYALNGDGTREYGTWSARQTFDVVANLGLPRLQTLAAAGAGQVRIGWDASSEPAVDVVIYHYYPGQDQWTMVEQQALTDTTDSSGVALIGDDRDVAGVHYFMVQAVNGGGQAGRFKLFTLTVQ